MFLVREVSVMNHTIRDRKYFYPAVITQEANSLYSVIFPDIEDCATSGETLEEIYEMAQDALCLKLYDMEECGEEIPRASAVPQIKLDDNQFIVIISCDTQEYRRYFDNRAVKKTLSIPSWLNTEAERQGVNFSFVLQEALKEKLNIQR